MMARTPKKFPDTYRNCVVCNAWADSADETRMRTHNGQYWCRRHWHRIDYGKGRVAFPKARAR